MEGAESTGDCCVIPDFSSSQCIFYPVKEEEREVLLGASQTNGENSNTGASSNALQTEIETADSNLGESLPFPINILP